MSKSIIASSVLSHVKERQYIHHQTIVKLFQLMSLSHFDNSDVELQSYLFTTSLTLKDLSIRQWHVHDESVHLHFVKPSLLEIRHSVKSREQNYVILK